MRDTEDTREDTENTEETERNSPIPLSVLCAFSVCSVSQLFFTAVADVADARRVGRWGVAVWAGEDEETESPL